MNTATLTTTITFASIASVCGGVFLVTRHWWLRSRETPAAPQELRRLAKLQTSDEATGFIAKFDDWFERTLSLSGWNLTPPQGAMLIVTLALATGGGVFILTENVLLTLMVAGVCVAGFFVSLVIARQRRLTQFEDQFPSALDLLARAVRAGESLEQGLALVGEAAIEPVGTELRRCSKQLEMGLALPACMRGLTQRIQLMDVRIFGNAVAVHREAGGDLPQTLDRLAAVIRDRHSYQSQMKSVTGAGRLSSILITVLGPVLFVFLFFVHPEYGRKLWDDPLGQQMLALAVVTQVIGVIWVLKLLKSDY